MDVGIVLSAFLLDYFHVRAPQIRLPESRPFLSAAFFVARQCRRSNHPTTDAGILQYSKVASWPDFVSCVLWKQCTMNITCLSSLNAQQMCTMEVQIITSDHDVTVRVFQVASLAETEFERCSHKPPNQASMWSERGLTRITQSSPSKYAAIWIPTDDVWSTGQLMLPLFNQYKFPFRCRCSPSTTIWSLHYLSFPQVIFVIRVDTILEWNNDFHEYERSRCIL